jgi:hypothetical protein
MIIKRIEPLSCAKIAGVIYGAIGLLIGALFSSFALLGIAFSSGAHGSAGHAISPLLGAALGIGAIIACPILYGMMGFVFAFLGAWLYNLVASNVGGIEIDIS